MPANGPWAGGRDGGGPLGSQLTTCTPVRCARLALRVRDWWATWWSGRRSRALTASPWNGNGGGSWKTRTALVIRRDHCSSWCVPDRRPESRAKRDRLVPQGQDRCPTESGSAAFSTTCSARRRRSPPPETGAVFHRPGHEPACGLGGPAGPALVPGLGVALAPLSCATGATRASPARSRREAADPVLLSGPPVADPAWNAGCPPATSSCARPAPRRLRVDDSPLHPRHPRWDRFHRSSS